MGVCGKVWSVLETIVGLSIATSGVLAVLSFFTWLGNNNVALSVRRAHRTT